MNYELYIYIVYAYVIYSQSITQTHGPSHCHQLGLGQSNLELGTFMKVQYDKHSIKGKLYSVAHPTKIHVWPSLVNYYPGPVCRAETVLSSLGRNCSAHLTWDQRSIYQSCRNNGRLTDRFFTLLGAHQCGRCVGITGY